MNTNTLAKHYKALRARERFPLFVAAGLRGDEAEAERLVHAAPLHGVRLPDYHGLAQGMGDLSVHLLRLLNEAVHLWHADSLRELNSRTGEKDEQRDRRDLRLVLLLRQRAFLFCVLQEAWQRFCAELHL